MKFLSVILVSLIALAPMSALAQTPDVIVTTDVVEAAPAPTVDILGPAIDVMTMTSTPAVEDVVVTDAPKVVGTDIGANIPVPQNELEAINQAGEAISMLAVGEWVGGILLLLGIAVFVYRKYFMKKPVK